MDGNRLSSPVFLFVKRTDMGVFVFIGVTPWLCVKLF